MLYNQLHSHNVCTMHMTQIMLNARFVSIFNLSFFIVIFDRFKPGSKKKHRYIEGQCTDIGW